jgi:hypothetical protein
MVVRELIAMMGIKTDKKGLADADKGMKKLVSVAKAAAAAFVGVKLVQWTKSAVVEVAKLGDTFDKMSKRTGFAVNTLQELQHAAELSGGSLGDIEMALRRLQAAQVDAGAGLKTYTREFDRLGIEIKDSEGNFKDTTELLFEMSDAMNNLDTDAERTAVAMKILGRSGTKLIPMMAEGSGGIREMMQEMRDLGGVMGKDLVEASRDYIDNQRRVDVMMNSVKFTIAKAFLPIMNRTIEAFTAWWKINGDLVRQKVGAFFSGLSRVLHALSRAVFNLGKGLKDFYNALPEGAQKVIKIGAAILGLVAVLALPAGSIILLIALIGLLIEDFEKWKAGGKSAIGAIDEALGELLGMKKPIKQFYDDLILWQEGYAAEAGLGWKEFFEEVGKVLLDYLSLSGRWWKEFFMDSFIGDLNDLRISFDEFMNDLWWDIENWVNDIISKITAPFRAVRNLILNLPSGKTTGKNMEGARNLLGAGAIGGGARAVGGARGGGSSIQNNVNVDVKTGPGVSAARIGTEVARGVRNALAQQNRTAMKELAPGN